MPIKMRCRRLNMHLYCKLLCRVLTLYVINKSKLHTHTHTHTAKVFHYVSDPPKNRINLYENQLTLGLFNNAI